MAKSSSSLVFKVQRGQPELVAPASPTPHEFKQLSDIDRQIYLQFQMPNIHFYAHNPSMEGKDPVKVFKDALAKALVFYYPYAGRLREGPNNKLIVDCTGEGVLFVEAEADVTLEQFGDPIHPPLPCVDELLYDVPGGSENIFDCPMMLFQVTRLKCGGFIIANRYLHALSDGAGKAQFWTAVSEIARGALAPSVLPIWQREILDAKDPPRITCTHNEYLDDDHDHDHHHVANGEGTVHDQSEALDHRSFFVGSKELSKIRRLIPSDLNPCTTFEVLVSCIWRCYTIASQTNPNEPARIQFPANARQKFNPPIPKGYYGNVLAMPIAETTVGKLCGNPLGHALQLIKDTKKKVNEEYMRSLASLMKIKGKPKGLHCFGVADIRVLGFDHVDYGWGEPLYSGPTTALSDHDSGSRAYLVSSKSKNGEQAIVIVISLPKSVMERFATLIEEILNLEPEECDELEGRKEH